MLVEELAGLEAVVELAEHAVEQVPLGLGVPVTALAPAPVVGFGSWRGCQGGEGPEEACRDESVVLDEGAMLRTCGSVLGGTRRAYLPE